MENKKKKILKNNKYHELITISLSIAIFFYFFYGFFSNENSAGAGGYDGDFDSIWNNLLILREEILFDKDVFINFDNPSYNDSRTPLSYILHIYLNPFIDNKYTFRLSVFIISLFLPLLIFFSIKQNYKNLSNDLVLLLALIVTLSPYFRTSAYWALGENYGLIFLVSSYLILVKIKKNYIYKNNFKNYFFIFFLCLFSSLCVYLDQKLIFVPSYALISILYLKINLRIKFMTIIFFALFALPYLYLINIWGSIIPPNAAEARLGGGLNLFNLGYCLTILAFYIMPFLLFEDLNLSKLKKKIINKEFFIILIIFLIYIFITLSLNDFEMMPESGKGLFHKLFLLFIDNINLRIIVTIITFLLGTILLKIFFNKKEDSILIFYFLLASIFIIPFYQEYLDPIIYILIFTFFKTRLNINYKKVCLLVSYFFIFSLSSKIYYNIIL